MTPPDKNNIDASASPSHNSTETKSSPSSKNCPPSSCPPLEKRPVPSGTFHGRVLPSKLTDFSSTRGKKMFASALLSGHAEAFFPLISQFDAQRSVASCGPASLTIVLNALHVDTRRVWSHPWRWTVEELIKACTTNCHSKNDKEEIGVSMQQLSSAASCYGLQAKQHRNLDTEQLRKLVSRSVSGNEEGPYTFLIASYNRAALGQTGSGHFSPIAAYDPQSDSVLILDVAKFKYPPHWVTIETLVDGINSIDSVTGLQRGIMELTPTLQYPNSDSAKQQRVQTENENEKPFEWCCDNKQKSCCGLEMANTPCC